MQLHEQVRPTTLDDIVGQPKVIARVKTLRARGLAGRSYWISGISGTGKTTLARIIASEVSSEMATEEMDAETITPKTIQEWERRTKCRPLGAPGWCLIINEAHGLRKDSVRQFLVTLERLPSYATVVFTTTVAGQAKLFADIDSEPLVSRCTRLSLQTKDLDVEFATHAMNVSRTEQLDGRPFADYLALVRRENCNLRAVLQAIESGEMLEPDECGPAQSRLIRR